MRQNIWKAYVYQNDKFHWETQLNLLFPVLLSKGHSTKHATLDIINAIQANMNQGLYSCGVLIDLKKAFDTVNHNSLI